MLCGTAQGGNWQTAKSGWGTSSLRTIKKKEGMCLGTGEDLYKLPYLHRTLALACHSDYENH